MQFNVIVIVTIFHLVILNLFVGILEGGLFMLKNKGKTRLAILWLILANYISWLIGTIFTLNLQSYFWSTSSNLDEMFKFWLISMIVLFGITTAIDIPFFFLAIKKEFRKIKDAALNSLIINIASFFAITALYFSASDFSLYTDFKTNQKLLEKNLDYELYILRSDNVYKDTLNIEFNPHIVSFEENTKELKGEFYLQKDSTESYFNLILKSFNSTDNLIQSKFLSTNDSSNVIDFKFYDIGDYIEADFDFRGTVNREWTIKTTGYLDRTFSINNTDGTEKKYLLETSWFFVKGEEPTILDNGLVLMLIDKKLVLMNIETKEIAYITRADSYAVRKINNTED